MSTLTVERGQPDFIYLHYDISDKHVRWDLTCKLLDYGFQMHTESVYYGPFSVPLYEYAKKLAERDSKGVKIRIITPAFPEDQATLLLNEFEAKFLKQFDEVRTKLDFIESALNNDITDEETGEYLRAKQIDTKIRNCNDKIEQIREAIQHRRECEAEMWKDEPDKFVKLEKRIKHMADTLFAYDEMNEKRRARENKKVHPGLRGA